MIAGALLSDYKAGVQSKGYGTDNLPAQVAAINSVRRRILGMRRWPFLDQRTTLATTIGTSAVALSTADMLSVNSVRIASGTNSADLDYMDPEELRALTHVDHQLVVPLKWTRVNAALEFYPIPDAVYTVTVDYTYTPVDLAADGDQDVIPRVYQDVISWGAIEELAYRERDWYTSSLAHQQYAERLKEMRGQYNIDQTQTSDEVVRWPGWSDVAR